VSSLSNQIEDLVLSGELPPGSKLDEQALAQRFEVSRTPVREALRQLASGGLVELKPNRGAFVCELSPDQHEELFVAMSELEATCARLAAMSMTPTERRDLQRLHESMGELAMRGLADEFFAANNRLHSMIYRGSHNRFLEDAAAALRRRLDAHRRPQFREADRTDRSQGEHDAVVKAIVSGDPQRAHSAMLHHLGEVETSSKSLVGL
jgi:DNA-binding GntR family transcriptional regulator